MRLLPALLFVLSTCLQSLAKTDSLAASNKREYRNSVILSIANFSIAGITPFDKNFIFPPYVADYIANQYGIQIEHELTGPFRVSMGYHAWNLFASRTDHEPDPYTSYLYDRRYVKGSRNINETGALRHRHGYKMLDAAVSYRYDKFARHKFSAGMGLSYTWGTNYYLTQRFFSTTENSYVYYTSKTSGNYAGMVLPLRYDLLFFKSILAVGAQVNARKYFGLQSWQIDYGVHLSVNF